MLEDVRTRLDVAPAIPCAVPSHGGGNGGPDAGRGGGASEQKHGEAGSGAEVQGGGWTGGEGNNVPGGRADKDLGSFSDSFSEKLLKVMPVCNWMQ